MTSPHEYHANTERPQTAKKLLILRKYFAVWLTIWSGEKCAAWVDKHWYVLDLFAGTGQSHGADGETISGSPLVFLEEIADKAARLHDAGIRITLVLVEQDPASCRQLSDHVAEFLSSHPEAEGVLDLKVVCEDCNAAVTAFTESTQVTAKTPAFVFVDPFGLAIRRVTMDALMSLPWAVDVLFNYMLDGIKRVYGAAVSGSSRAESNAATLGAYFGEGVPVTSQAMIEDPKTYARPAFASHGLRTVAFYVKWPSKEAIQYILLFACRKPAVVDIMRDIYAKEMADQYGQGSLFGHEEHLAQIEVIEP